MFLVCFQPPHAGRRDGRVSGLRTPLLVSIAALLLGRALSPTEAGQIYFAANLKLERVCMRLLDRQQATLPNPHMTRKLLTQGRVEGQGCTLHVLMVSKTFEGLSCMSAAAATSVRGPPW
jgi:hypothetical protein